MRPPCRMSMLELGKRGRACLGDERREPLVANDFETVEVMVAGEPAKGQPQTRPMVCSTSVIDTDARNGMMV